jgi:uncharacterized protein (TIGR02145 family)
MRITFFVFLSIELIVILQSCKRFTIPDVTTANVTQITTTSAVSGGNVISEGRLDVSTRGVCWSTNQNPTYALPTKTTDGGGDGDFISSINGLMGNTTYYVRAYAINTEGIGYGNEVNFTTQSDIVFNSDLTYGTISDIVGNDYKTIQIGSQVWMAENLKTSKYRNGDLIRTTTPATLDITSEATPKYQWAYDGDESNVSIYGRLYTWYALTDTRKICPTGWHIPSDVEWETLKSYLGGGNVAGGKLKETGTTHWTTPNTGATNESGFTALPTGVRGPGWFVNIGNHSYFWCSTTESNEVDAVSQGIYNNTIFVVREANPKYAGLPVRCLKDN